MDERLEPENRKRLINNLKEEIKQEVMRVWQHRWDNENRGRVTYGFIREVGVIRDEEWDYRTTSFLTGHGFFSENLERFGLADNPLCPCGEIQSGKHLLTKCVLTAEARRRIIAEDNPVDCSWYLQERNNFDKFRDLAEEIFEMHEQGLV